MDIRGEARTPLALESFGGGFNVLNLPAWQKAHIKSRNDGTWSLMLTNRGITSNWAGTFKSAEDALELLQKQVDPETPSS